MARRRKKKQQRIRKAGKKIRNPYALIGQLRTGSGRHPNKRNVQRKKACRKKVHGEGEVSPSPPLLGLTSRLAGRVKNISQKNLTL